MIALLKFPTVNRQCRPPLHSFRWHLTGWSCAVAVAAAPLVDTRAAPVPTLRRFPLSAGQRGMVTCLANPAIQYDVYLPPSYSPALAPLPILYTCNPSGGGMVSNFQAVCANLQIIVVGLISPKNLVEWDVLYRDFHAVARDIRRRVLFDPTAEIVGGMSGGGVASYEFSRFRPQHVTGVYAMGSWLGSTSGNHDIEEWVQYNLLVARATGTTDSAAANYLSADKKFLTSCGAVVTDFSYTGGHVVPPDSQKSESLTWILDHREKPGANDRSEALAQATDWWTRIDTGGQQAVLREAADALMSRPRSWHAYQAQLILDELLGSPSFRSLEVADLARGDFANNHFYFTARGAALNDDLQTYHGAMKALTGIMAVYGDRSEGIASMLDLFGFLSPVLRISQDAGRLNLSIAKDTPGLTYSLESSPTLTATNWRGQPDLSAETNTEWSAGFDLPPEVPTEFYRVRATAAAP
jgi:hypothetical protein